VRKAGTREMQVRAIGMIDWREDSLLFERSLQVHALS
jgi:hypothetical protein